MPAFEGQACGPDQTYLFFSPVAAEEEQARAICRSCPARSVCRDWAVKTGQDGVWGATTESERRNLRRNQRSNT